MKANDFLVEMESYLKKNFPEFQIFDPKDKERSFAFYSIHPKKNLTIVVYPSVVYSHGKPSFATNYLKIILKKTKDESLLALSQTPRKFWKESTKDKVAALRQLIEVTGQCPVCQTQLLPRRCETRKKTKKDGSGTLIVRLFCPQCQKWFNTPYGIGLKTALHKYLK